MRLARNVLLTLVGLVVLAVLLVALWPAPNALLVRHVLTGSESGLARSLASRVPDDVAVRTDLPYGEGPSRRLDVVRPRGDEPLPVVVWFHGGGWAGGDKADVRPYLQVLAGEGFAVVGVNYSLAPGATYPTPVREGVAAVRRVVADAAELGIDPDRVVLGGDSAGAQIAAQVAAATTDPVHAAELGVRPPLPADDLRGIVLHSGAVDPGRMAEGLPGLTGRVLSMAVRSYLGDDREGNAAQARVVDHVTGAFPPTWLTSGNGDPLAADNERLAARLDRLGVDVTTRFYPRDHRPELGHEYQFDLDLSDGQAVLDQTAAFVARVTD